MQKQGPFSLDDMEFGRRLAVEREIEKQKAGQSVTVNAVFDDSGNFLIYATLLGIKMVNLVTNKVVRVLGKSETARFMNITLYQGSPNKKKFISLVTSKVD
jgi:peptidylprolyl isomerase domain and WD repeat-containing protein 1